MPDFTARWRERSAIERERLLALPSAERLAALEKSIAETKIDEADARVVRAGLTELARAQEIIDLDQATRRRSAEMQAEYLAAVYDEMRGRELAIGSSWNRLDTVSALQAIVTRDEKSGETPKAVLAYAVMRECRTAEGILRLVDGYRRRSNGEDVGPEKRT